MMKGQCLNCLSGHHFSRSCGAPKRSLKYNCLHCGGPNGVVAGGMSLLMPRGADASVQTDLPADADLPVAEDVEIPAPKVPPPPRRASVCAPLRVKINGEMYATFAWYLEREPTKEQRAMAKSLCSLRVIVIKDGTGDAKTLSDNGFAVAGPSDPPELMRQDDPGNLLVAPNLRPRVKWFKTLCFRRRGNVPVELRALKVDEQIGNLSRYLFPVEDLEQHF